jgi:hypothetical protein
MFSSMKLGTRMGASFALVLALMVGLGLVSLERLGAIQGNFKTVALQNNEKIALGRTVRKPGEKFKDGQFTQF